MIHYMYVLQMQLGSFTMIITQNNMGFWIKINEILKILQWLILIIKLMNMQVRYTCTPQEANNTCM